MNEDLLIENAAMIRRFSEFSTLADLDLHPQRLPAGCNRAVCAGICKLPGGAACVGLMMMEVLGLRPVPLPDELQPRHRLALEPSARLNRALDLTAKAVMKPGVSKVIERMERLRIRSFLGESDFLFLTSTVPLLISRTRLELLSKDLEADYEGDLQGWYQITLSNVIKALWGRESLFFRRRVELKLADGLSVPAETQGNVTVSPTLSALAIRILSQIELEEPRGCFA
ncbi:MAG: hypothetical protein RLZZ436_4213 [Planctomycetota bacterium]